MISAKYRALIDAAKKARKNAYAPYSKFKVGAAVLGKSGKIFSACKVENASYGLTVCAERNAATQAVADGERTIVAVAVVAESPIPVPPCGACRQFLAEFGPGMDVLVPARGSVRLFKLSSLLPESFSGKNLK